MPSFERCLALVLQHEGGYVDHSHDPGGATNLGVTIGTLSSWLGRPATKAEVRALSVADVAPIYRRNYWTPVRGDDLPAGVDFTVFDFAVNSGPRRAIMSLQRALNVADDGVLGTVTLEAARRKHPEDTITRICADRLAFMRRLSTWPVFGVGWQRRVEGVEREAVRMALEAAGQRTRVTIDYTTPAPAKPELNCFQKLLRGKFGTRA